MVSGEDVIRWAEMVPTVGADKPKHDVVIADCGEWTPDMGTEPTAAGALGEGYVAPSAETVMGEDAAGKEWRAAVAKLEAEAGTVYTAAEPGTFNAAKHVPLVAVEARTCTVTVPHGMAADHFIQYIWAKDSSSGEVVAGVELKPDDEPKLTFEVPSGTGSIAAFEACNQHGVWSSDSVAL